MAGFGGGGGGCGGGGRKEKKKAMGREDGFVEGRLFRRGGGGARFKAKGGAADRRARPPSGISL